MARTSLSVSLPAAVHKCQPPCASSVSPHTRSVPHTSARPGQHTRLPGLSPADPSVAAVGERVRSIPRKRTAVGAALLSPAALLAVGAQTVPAAAQPAAPHPSPLRAGGLPADITPAQRT